MATTRSTRSSACRATRSCAILPDYDALVVRSQVKADAEMIAAGTRLVVIGRAGVGVDNVDLEAATRAGIIVVNAPTGNTIAAAEHTLALLFGLARQTAAARRVDAPRRVEALRSSRAASCAARRSGIVGLGKIGQAIAVRARAMQMTVLGSDPFVTARAGRDLRRRARPVRRASSRGPTSSRSTCPRRKATTGMINREVMARMKPGVILLNVARGGIIDEQDLADALRDGRHRRRRHRRLHRRAADRTARCSTRRTRSSRRTSARPPRRPRSRSPRRSRSRSSRCSTAGSARYAVNAPLLTAETAQAIAPYLPLAETLGRFAAQLRPVGAADAHRSRSPASPPRTTRRRSSRRSSAGCSRRRPRSA